MVVASCGQSNPNHLTKRDRVRGGILDRQITVNAWRVRVIPVNSHSAGAVELNHTQAAGWIAADRDSVIDRPD